MLVLEMEVVHLSVKSMVCGSLPESSLGVLDAESGMFPVSMSRSPSTSPGFNSSCLDKLNRFLPTTNLVQLLTEYHTIQNQLLLNLVPFLHFVNEHSVIYYLLNY